MSRSFTYLRRGLAALAMLGALGFGATQALATPGPDAAAVRYCPDRGFDYAYASCGFGCPGGRGYCAAGGICRCGLIP
jgi:hypothetical protein